MSFHLPDQAWSSRFDLFYGDAVAWLGDLDILDLVGRCFGAPWTRCSLSKQARTARLDLAGNQMSGNVSMSCHALELEE
jgi:hypothetical protein